MKTFKVNVYYMDVKLLRNLLPDYTDIFYVIVLVVHFCSRKMFNPN